MTDYPVSCGLGFSNDCLAWCTNYFSDKSSVCQIGGSAVRTSGSLYGGATGFKYSISSLYTSMRSLLLLVSL